MRIPLILLLLTAASATTVSANESNFGGVWTGWDCPRGASPNSGKCANLVLELHQKQDKLCGSHMFATAGATQIDEGGAPSITGTAHSESANVTAESIVKGAQAPIKAELRLVNGRLEWKRTDDAGSGSLLPQAMKLTRSKHATLFHPVFEQQLKAVCSTILNANANATPAAPRPMPPGRVAH